MACRERVLDVMTSMKRQVYISPGTKTGVQIAWGQMLKGAAAARWLAVGVGRAEGVVAHG